eukprot:3718946-Karenia_brevis.AAC.1
MKLLRLMEACFAQWTHLKGPKETRKKIRPGHADFMPVFCSGVAKERFLQSEVTTACGLVIGVFENKQKMKDLMQSCERCFQDMEHTHKWNQPAAVA